MYYLQVKLVVIYEDYNDITNVTLQYQSKSLSIVSFAKCKHAKTNDKNRRTFRCHRDAIVKVNVNCVNCDIYNEHLLKIMVVNKIYI